MLQELFRLMRCRCPAILISVTIISLAGCKKNDPTPLPVPQITSFSPPAGLTGDAVIIAGDHFNTDITKDTVKFSGIPAIIVRGSTTQLVVTVPKGAATGKITVTVGNLIATSSGNFTVNALPVLQIAGFSPAQAKAGETVTITGTNFSATLSANTVKFNGVQAIVLTASVTSLTVTVPANATTGKITVAIGGNTVTSAAEFTVTASGVLQLNSFSPTGGLAGDTITIDGNNFAVSQADNTVDFAGQWASVIKATTTQLKVLVPGSAVSGKISVSVNNIKVSAAADFTVNNIYILTLSVNGALSVWKNQTTVVVTLPANGYVSPSFAVSDGNVYVAANLVSNGYIPVLYKNNTAQTITKTSGASSSGTTGVAVIGSNVYVSGYQEFTGKTVATYWLNGTPVNLPDGTGNSNASALCITAAGTDVYMAGAVNNGKTFVARYWQNGGAADLALSGDARLAGAIAIASNTTNGSDVVIVGNEQKSGGGNTVRVWGSGGSGADLTDPTKITYPKAAAVNGSEVYVVGYEQASAGKRNIAKYWRNGLAQNLTDGTRDGVATAVAYFNNNVYIVGADGPGGGNFWKNGIAEPYRLNASPVGIIIAP